MLATKHFLTALALSLSTIAAESMAQTLDADIAPPIVRRGATNISSTRPAAKVAHRPSASSPPATNLVAKLPPAPPGVTDLKFSELYKPVGSRGLEYSDTLRGLDGRKVRVLGYMVKQTRPVPWMFLLSPIPVTLHESEYGFAEDMPATIVHVTTPRNATPIVPFTPGLMLLTGTLSIGNREEADGRVSSIRLALDPPPVKHRAGLAPATDNRAALSTNAASRESRRTLAE